MNVAVLESLAAQALHTPIYPDPRFPPSPYYRFLFLLAAHLQPMLSVELGVCGGGGSLHLALGWPQGTVVGVDVAWDHAENIEYVRVRCPNFHFWRGDSVESAPEIYRQYGEVDILFVDTTHTYEQTTAEYDAYKSYLSARAVVCLDDLFRPGMDRAWDEMPEPKLRLDRMHSGPPRELGGGFGVLWR